LTFSMIFFFDLHNNFPRYHLTQIETLKSGFVVQDKYVLVSWIQNFNRIGWKMATEEGKPQS
jgi:plasmid replication initiation protein